MLLDCIQGGIDEAARGRQAAASRTLCKVYNICSMRCNIANPIWTAPRGVVSVEQYDGVKTAELRNAL